MPLKFRDVADPPDVVAAPIFGNIFGMKFVSGNLFAERNRFEHRAIAVACAAHVIDLTASRSVEERVKRTNQVSAVNVVPHLLFFVAEDGVRRFRNSALHQISQESVKLCSRMIWTREASAAETGRFHSKITAVLLHQNVGGNL